MLELPVARLQVQVHPLKPGRAPWRAYEPAALHQVSELMVAPSGVVGVDDSGAEHVDVHNTEHPQSRDRKGRAGISVMATGDYVALRARYGAHLVNGIAGESILVEFELGLAGFAMPVTVAIRSASSPAMPLTGVHVAQPCVEFTRFCLRLPASDLVGEDVTSGLDDLGGGARGYKMVAGCSGRVRVGDVLVIDG